MSLILGINLPQYLFLASDTRLTLKSEKKDDNYEDNFCKFYCFNESLSSVVAGNAKLASFILRKISKSEISHKGFVYFKDNIEEFIKPILDDFMKEGNEYTSVFLIFAGFDEKKQKKIKSSQYGKTLASTFVPGKKQVFDRKIMEKIVEEAIKNGPGTREGEEGVIGSLEGDNTIEIDYPYSSIITVEIHLPSKLIIKEVGTYEYIMRAPRKITESKLPSDLAYKLESDLSKYGKGEDTLQAQTVVLTAWIKKIAEDNKLDNVGGEVMVNMITPKGAVMLAGSIASLEVESGKSKIISEIIVHKGKFCVKDKKTDNIIPLKNVYDFTDEGNFEL